MGVVTNGTLCLCGIHIGYNSSKGCKSNSIVYCKKTTRTLQKIKWVDNDSTLYYCIYTINNYLKPWYYSPPWHFHGTVCNTLQMVQKPQFKHLQLHWSDRTGLHHTCVVPFAWWDGLPGTQPTFPVVTRLLLNKVKLRSVHSHIMIPLLPFVHYL